MESPFDITVYDKAFAFKGFVVDPTYVNMVPSWWNQGYMSFMLAADNPHSAALQAKGARVVVHYKGKHVMSGPVRSRRGDLVGAKGATITYQVLDDRRVLVNTLAWVRPDQPLAASSLSDLGQAWLREGETATIPGKVVHQYSYFRWPDGSAAAGGHAPMASAEEAIKYLCRINFEAIGLPITILPNQGRGGNPSSYLPIVRMEPLSEAIQPIMNRSGLSTRIWQEKNGTGLLMDVVEPGEWTQELTPESGVISEGVYAVNAPDVTRVVVGGPGQTAGRIFGGQTDRSSRTSLENTWGDVVEVFRESGSFDFAWPEGLDDEFKVPKYYKYQVAADEFAKLAKLLTNTRDLALEEFPELSSLAMTLSETETFHYGGPDGVQLGDRIKVRASGQLFENQITEAQIVFTRDRGLVINPLVGQIEDDPDVVLAKALANVAKALRTMSTSK